MPPHLLYEELHNNIENVPTWNPTLIECRSLKVSFACSHTNFIFVLVDDDVAGLLQVIDDKTSISYQVAAEGGGGIVSSRDFVNLRYCDIRNGIFVCSGKWRLITIIIDNKAIHLPDRALSIRRNFDYSSWYAPTERPRARGEWPRLLGHASNSQRTKQVHLSMASRHQPQGKFPSVASVVGITSDIRLWFCSFSIQGWIPQSIIDSALSFAMCDYVRYIRNYGSTLRNQGKFWSSIVRPLNNDC